MPQVTVGLEGLVLRNWNSLEGSQLLMMNSIASLPCIVLGGELLKSWTIVCL
jgi:hypothetical protein